MTFILHLSILIFTLVQTSTHAHSHLADPLPDRELHCRVGGEARDCYGPCPPSDDYGRLNPVNRNQPAEVWGRGQWVNIRWHKDNHDGTGFVRLTLVPLDKMYDKNAHDKYAFAFLCMNAGPHSCPDLSYDACGNDFEGKAWQKMVKVPTSYPDGVYAFGWSWYGGGNYLDRSFFGDYYSCSYVEIRGGGPVAYEYAPVFDSETGTCRSSTDKLGVCWKEPCDIGGMYDMIPIEFNNEVPAPIRRDDVSRDNGMNAGMFGGGGGAFVSAGGSNGGSSVMLGARGGGRDRNVGNGRNEPDERDDGKLRVYFLDFEDWSKVDIVDEKYYRLHEFRKGLTVEAFYDEDVRFVEFFVDNLLVRKETAGPFVMNGNRGQLINAWNVPTGRMVSLRVEAMSKGGRREGFRAKFRFD